MRTLPQRIALIAVVAALLGLIGLLWDVRPPLPGLSTSLVSGHVKQTVRFLGWLGFSILTLGLLDRTVRRCGRRSPTPARALRHLRPATRRDLRASMRDGYTRTAFPLIPRGGRPAEPRIVSERSLFSAAGAEIDAGPVDPVSLIDPPPNGPPRPTIALLGPVTITGTKKSGRRLRGPTRELLCYLALHPHGAHRDQIIAALWPDQPPERGKSQLWRATADARNHLGDTGLIRDGEVYQLNRAEVAIDVDLLEQLQQEGSRTAEMTGRLRLLEQALALFRGEPLAGTDFLWADSHHRRLHAAQLDLLERVGTARLDAGDAAGALATLEEGVVNEPCNERLARIAMRAEAALGLRSAIIARHNQLCRQLDEQLGLQPDRETRSLYRQLLSQDRGQDRGAPVQDAGAHMFRGLGGC